MQEDWDRKGESYTKAKRKRERMLPEFQQREKRRETQRTRDWSTVARPPDDKEDRRVRRKIERYSSSTTSYAIA